MTSVRIHAIGATLCVLLQIASAANVYGGFPVYSPTLSLEKRSPRTNCNREVVENLANIARDTCTHIATVDRYINDVKSKNPMPEPSFTDTHGFKAILSQYNRDLGTAKSHSHPWRNGDNIVASMKAVVLSAQGFEPKFKQEFAKSQAKIKTLLENHEDIAEVEEKVATLRKALAKTKEVAKHAKSPTLKAHLESVIVNTEEEIKNTMEKHEIIHGRRELAELVKSLELVKTGAFAIKDKTNSLSTKLSNFRQHISQDAGAFKRHQRNAQEGSTNLEEERRKNNDEIVSNKKSIFDLRLKITDENNQISSLKAQIARALQESRDILERSIIALVSYVGDRYRIPPFAGSKVMVEYTNPQIQNLRNHIATRVADIKRHQKRIAALEARSQQLNMELHHFMELNRNLQNLERDVNSILPFIESAVDSVGKIKAIFDSVEQNLGSVIEKAKEAKTAAEIRDMRYFIYNEINEMECKWESAKSKIVLAGKCA